MNYRLLTNIGLLFLRVSISLIMLSHGIPKVQMLLEGNGAQFADPIGLGSTFSLILVIGAEVGCSLMLIAGFKSRLFALPLIFNMIIAAFVAHSGDGFGKQELPILYLLIYTTIALVGSGEFSLDHFLAERKKRKRYSV